MAARTLLVADDSQTVHRIVEMACEGEDVEVLAADDGDQAIAQILEHPPDLVLADISMPGRNGYDLAAFVRSRSDLAHIPVVLMAGMFEGADEERAKRLGCAEVLVKPLKPQHIATRLKHWLDSIPTPAPVPPSVPEPEPEPEPVAPDAGTEDYFSRLDAAFKSLGRPIGQSLATPLTPSDSETASASVPTLQELLSRLPEETRTRLTASVPAAASEEKREASVLDTIIARVVDDLSTRDDVLDEIARRITMRLGAGEGR